MITILYDTTLERDAMIEYIRTSSGCVDFSDRIDDARCITAPAACNECKDDLINYQMYERSTYHDVMLIPAHKPIERTCKTCDNAPICWLACTAAAPYPCRHYKPMEARHDAK